MQKNVKTSRSLKWLTISCWLCLSAIPVAAYGQTQVDFDGDGIQNEADLCPHSNHGSPIDTRGCEHDHDADGVVNAIDQCPDSDAGIPVNIRGCGHDSDADQVVDFRDACPNTEASVRVDATGCELGDALRLPGLIFAKGSSILNNRAKSVLDRAANTLFKYPELQIEVAGFTDSKGNNNNNRKLSQERANAVRGYLMSIGISASRVTAKGYGEANPVAPNNTAAGRAANRRVVLKLTS